MIKHACRSKVDIFIARGGYSSFQERDVPSWFFFPLVNKIDRNTRDEGKMLNYKHCSRIHTATKQKCQTGILRNAKLFQLFHIYDFHISTIIMWCIFLKRKIGIFINDFFKPQDHLIYLLLREITMVLSWIIVLSKSIILRDFNTNNKTYPLETSFVRCTITSLKLQQIE